MNNYVLSLIVEVDSLLFPPFKISQIPKTMMVLNLLFEPREKITGIFHQGITANMFI